jgi:hypothetical protein
MYLRIPVTKKENAVYRPAPFLLILLGLVQRPR